MDNFKSQIIHVVNTVDKLAPTDRMEALSYLQKITEAFKNKSLPSDFVTNSLPNLEPSVKPTTKTVRHKCKNHLCLTYNIKHLKKIACFKCEKRLESEFQLFEHLQTHLDYPLSCIHCHCVFRNIEDFSSHKTIDCKQTDRECSQNAQKYVCTVCRSSFANKKTFHSHLLDNHGMKLYNNWYGCKLCREMFEQKKMLYHHYKQAHSNLNSQWEITKKENTDVSNMQNDAVSDADVQNVTEHEDAEKFQCFHCNKCFRKKFMLSVHVKRHLRKKEFVCDLCKKSFSVYKYYRRHLQSASHQSKDGLDNHPLFKCELCENKVFANRDSLSRHHLRVHFTADRLLKCPLCAFTTGLQTSLTRHVNLHTDNRKFICDQCGACFHTLSALKEHTVYVHSNDRNYSCEICGQRFKLKSGLNRHLKTHSDDKEFKCFCGQVYKFRTNLKRHLMNTHKMTEPKSRVFRVTTEEEGYAINNPKLVRRKVAKQEKVDDVDDNRIDDFDISSLGALSDVDLSDEVLRETYDNFAKYSAQNGESQESFSCMLAPVNNLIDRVLQETNNEMRTNRAMMESNKPYVMTNEDSMNHLPAMNYRSTTCRQYLSPALGDQPGDHQYAQTNTRLDNQYLNSSPGDHQYALTSTRIDNQYMNSFDNMNPICDAYNKQCSTTHYMQNIAAEDESSFSYAKWLNEIL